MTSGQNSTNLPYEIYQVFYQAKDYGAGVRARAWSW